MANDKIAVIRVYHEAAFDRGAQEWDFVKLTLTDAQGRATERQIMGCDTKTGADGAWYFLLYVMVDGNKVELAQSRQQGASPLTPFVEDLVRAYQEAGYLLQGAPTADRSPLDFGVWKTTYNAVLMASPAAKPLRPDGLPRGWVQSGAESAEAARLAEARRWADRWTTCTLTQQVQWQLRKPYGLIDERIAREYANSEGETQLERLFDLGALSQRDGRFKAFLTAYDREDKRIVDPNFWLESAGGGRPTPESPPATHLNQQVAAILKEMRALGWRLEERTADERADDTVLRYTVTYRFTREAAPSG